MKQIKIYKRLVKIRTILDIDVGKGKISKQTRPEEQNLLGGIK